MTRTSIEWVRNQDGSQGFTVNPIRFRNKATGKVGHYCEKVSPGCKYCYASRMQTGPYLSGLEFIAENKDRGELFFDEAVLQQVIRRQKPSTFFWCDMTDLFGPWVSDKWQDRITAVCSLTPQHRHLWLTKRAKEMREYFTELQDGRVDDVYEAATDMAHADFRNTAYLQSKADRLIDNWPLSNLGLGVSAEDQDRAYERIPNLLMTPAAMRYMSGEPLLGALEVSHWLTQWTGRNSSLPKPLSTALATLPDIHGLDWVITGGETGLGARPMPPEWPRAIRDQCQQAKVPYFHKHNGEWSPMCENFHKVSNHTYSHDTLAWNRDGTPYNAFNPPAGSFPSRMMYRVGKKAAGRKLDGRTWDELPEMLR
jgi:protein gp37